MATTPQQALARLRDMAGTGALAAFCRQAGIDVLVAFGSAADPARAATARDLDLAVLLDDGSGADVLRVVGALVDLTHCEDIDVLDLRRAGVVAQEQALVGTLPLYERAPGTIDGIRDRAVVLRMDTDWLRRLDLEIMAES